MLIFYIPLLTMALSPNTVGAVGPKGAAMKSIITPVLIMPASLDLSSSTCPTMSKHTSMASCLAHSRAKPKQPLNYYCIRSAARWLSEHAGILTAAPPSRFPADFPYIPAFGWFVPQMMLTWRRAQPRAQVTPLEDAMAKKRADAVYRNR